MASLSYKNSRLVRSLDTKTGARKGFGLDNATEVVSARCSNFPILFGACAISGSTPVNAPLRVHCD